MGNTENKPKGNSITVVLCEPGRTARTVDIENTLEAMQKAVGGYIEPFYCFSDYDVCIVCNEEGKISGEPLNRAVYDESHRIMDIICGSFFICDCSGENFASLSNEKLEYYTDMFRNPERFFRINGEITALPYNADEIEEEIEM